MTAALDELDSLPAGPEADALVAVEVMGWRLWDGEHDYDGPEGVTIFRVDPGLDALAVYEAGSDDVTRYFAPSRAVADACEVLGRVDGGSPYLQYLDAQDVPVGMAPFWAAGIWARPAKTTAESWKPGRAMISAHAETMELAIVRMALKVKRAQAASAAVAP